MAVSHDYNWCLQFTCVSLISSGFSGLLFLFANQINQSINQRHVQSIFKLKVVIWQYKINSHSGAGLVYVLFLIQPHNSLLLHLIFLCQDHLSRCIMKQNRKFRSQKEAKVQMKAEVCNRMLYIKVTNICLQDYCMSHLCHTSTKRCFKLFSCEEIILRKTFDSWMGHQLF